MPASAAPAPDRSPSAVDAVPDAVPVVLAGGHGYGRSHLANLERLAAAGTGIRLAGVCDPRPPSPELAERTRGLPWQADLGALIDRVGARVVILATPIHTHAELAALAAARGCAILLEKPPTATLDSFTGLLAELDRTGTPCQVGFQDLASPATEHVRTLVLSGALGELQGIGVTGTWIRDSSYFTRGPWSGRRSLGGVPVVDGVLSNPFAHAVASALVVDGSDGRVPPERIELELYRANEIESDDTSCLRLRTARGTPVVVAATLCAERTGDPVITVRGSRGSLDLHYKQSTVYHRGAPDAEPTVLRFARADLLENLVAHLRDPSRPLLVPAAATTAFMHVLEAIRTAPDPVPIPPGGYRELPSDVPGSSGPAVTAPGTEVTRRVVPGVDLLVAQAAQRLALFSELGAPWARPAGSAR